MGPRARTSASEAGISLVETVVVLMVAAIAVSVTVSSFQELNRAAALAGAAGRLRGLMFRCRAFAIMNQRSTGLVFELKPDGSWRCFIAADGDHDGILRRDIERGTDPIVSEVLDFAPRVAGIGILDGVVIPDPSGRGRLRGDLTDPVRAGRGDVITFTPRGHATPSSVYLTDHRSRMRVLRVYGGTGRVNSLVWREGWDGWRRSAL
jgi:competence protein ComGC